MNCNDYEKHFSDYLDGLLNQELGDELRFHLNGCPRCHTKMDDMERSIMAVRGLPPLAPRPDFEQALRGRIYAERTRELYAVPFWVSMKNALSEVAQFSRQRPVRLVFATSLLLTIAVISSIALFPTGGPMLANLTVPASIEPELASWDIVSPIPFEPNLAPAMAIAMDARMVPSRVVPNTPVSVLTNSAAERPAASTHNMILTIPTMDYQTALESTPVSAVPEQRLNAAGPLANQTINLNVSRQRNVNAFMTGGMPLNRDRGQTMKRLSRPSSQIKRIRISF